MFQRARTSYFAAAVAGCLAVLNPSNAAIVSATGTVSVILTYANFGNGDFAFRVSNPVAGCYGFWVSPSQPGFKTTVAFILKAHASGDSILVGADDAQIWPGSGSPWCRVDYVGTPY
jgi:hypothetical protein